MRAISENKTQKFPYSLDGDEVDLTTVNDAGEVIAVRYDLECPLLYISSVGVPTASKHLLYTRVVR